MDKFKYQSIEFIHLFCSSLGEEEKILRWLLRFLAYIQEKNILSKKSESCVF